MKWRVISESYDFRELCPNHAQFLKQPHQFLNSPDVYLNLHERVMFLRNSLSSTL